MARLHVLAVANRLPAWAEAARDQYLQRMPRGYEVELLQLRPKDAGKIREKIPKHTLLVALDERGKDLSTMQFAALLPSPPLSSSAAPTGSIRRSEKKPPCCCAFRRLRCRTHLRR